MQAERVLSSYVLRVLARSHEPVYCLHDLRTGKQLEFRSLDQVTAFLQIHQLSGLDPPKSLKFEDQAENS